MTRRKRQAGAGGSLDSSPGPNVREERKEDSDFPALNGMSGKSRSLKKRESTAMQRRGEELAALPPAMLGRLPLPPELAQALALWRGLKSHEAKRRHMQYIGRLMRELGEPEALLSALDELKAESGRGVARFARQERLRDALLDPVEAVRESALEEALANFPALRKTKLIHLIQGALAEREKKQPPRQARALFRYLRDGEGPE